MHPISEKEKFSPNRPLNPPNGKIPGRHLHIFVQGINQTVQGVFMGRSSNSAYICPYDWIDQKI